MADKKMTQESAESVKNADSENIKAKTSDTQDPVREASSENGKSGESEKQKTLDAMEKADADSEAGKASGKSKAASGKGDAEMSEEEIRKLKGVGGRQMRGVKVKVDNAPQIFKRVMAYVMKRYGVQIVIVVICIFCCQSKF